jgi:serine/threonine protein kinase
LKTGGSLPAMSPQQLAGELPDVTDDVYALGSLMYELLSGFPLFHPEAIADQVRDEIPARLEHNYAGEVLPKSLGDLFAAMLDKSAARRPQGMRAVIAMLESCIAEQAVDTTSASSAATADTIQIVSRGAARPVPAASQISRK